MKFSKNIFGSAWPWWILSLAALLLVAGSLLIRWNMVSGQPTNPGASSADQSFIQGLQQALSSSRLSAADRQALEKKLEYSQRLADQQAARPKTHGPKGALKAPVPMPQAAVNPDQGEHILPGSEGLTHSWEASINNLWEGSYNGIDYQVLAGSSPDDPSQGLVIVLEYPSSQDLPIRHTYPAPSGSGSLSIVARQASRLQLAATNGSTLYFDLETRAFQ